MRKFWHALCAWSEKQFGLSDERGPIGPLKHLQREIEELLQCPDDPEEYADAVFLIFDAAWRAGVTYPELMETLWYKLGKNKRRNWPPTSATGVVEHVKGVND